MSEIQQERKTAGVKLLTRRQKKEKGKKLIKRISGFVRKEKEEKEVEE